MKDKSPIIILLVLFVFIGLAYGPIKKASSNKSSSENAANSSSAIGAANANNLGYSSNTEVAEKIKKTEKTINSLSEKVSDIENESERSPYYNKVKMSKISNLNDSNPNKEYLTLSTDLDKTETIKITGWFLKSLKSGNYAIIGGADLLPYPFTHTESEIILQYKDKVILNKGYSPIGISFRTNKCTGYFEENRSFYPSLSLKCPLAKNENLPTFSNNEDSNDRCITAIKKISVCTTKGSSFLRDLEDTVNQSCKNYIRQVNYNYCIANHFDDTDFPGNEYRVFFGTFGALWRDKDKGDKINLYDENGLVVDSISY